MKEQNPTSQTVDHIKRYINLKIDVILLSISQKMSNAIAFFVFAIIMGFVFIFLSLFLSLSLSEWLANVLNMPGIGNLIVSGIYLLLGIIIYAFRKKLILQPISKNMGNIMDMSDLNNDTELDGYESFEIAIQTANQRIHSTEEDINQNISAIKDYYSFEQLRDRFLESIVTNPKNILNVLLILREVIRSRKKKV